MPAAAGPALCLFFQLFLHGCAQQASSPPADCPALQSVSQAVAILGHRRNNSVDIKASGKCIFRYRDGKNGIQKESFPVKIWLSPPDRLYLQGDVAFDPKAVIAGTDGDEFWLAIRHKSVSSYWWGPWVDGSSAADILIDAKLVTEILVGPDISDGLNWSLAVEKNHDILFSDNGPWREKRLYLNRCDRLPRRIEYLDRQGDGRTMAQLERYRPVNETFSIPTVISIRRFDDMGEPSTMIDIDIDSARSTKFSPLQEQRLFARPRPDNFEHVYKISDGKITER